jgi:cytochrome c peroxidase
LEENEEQLRKTETEGDAWLLGDPHKVRTPKEERGIQIIDKELFS